MPCVTGLHDKNYIDFKTSLEKCFLNRFNVILKRLNYIVAYIILICRHSITNVILVILNGLTNAWKQLDLIK